MILYLKFKLYARLRMEIVWLVKFQIFIKTILICNVYNVYIVARKN